MKNSPSFASSGVSGVRLRSLALALCRVMILGCLWLPGACGTLRSVPAPFTPQDYTPIDYQDLLKSGPAGLHDGQKIRVQAYYWQPLDYDQAIVRNYLTLPRYPSRWYQLRWFATYGAPDLRGYYDLAAMTPAQAESYKLKRLDPITIYGEMTELRPGLYLQVHHIEKIPPP